MVLKYLIAIDGPDPDNLALVAFSARLLGKENLLGVLLTGRPVNKQATKETPTSEWSYSQSLDVQRTTAYRFQNFMRSYSINADTFDGGIFPHTLVPHHLHFNDETGFCDVDLDEANKNLKLKELSELRARIGMDRFIVLIGGPMTGLKDLLVRYPELSVQVESVHAMYGTLGNVELMSLGGEKRGMKQFNVACDPQAGRYVIDSLKCPIYFITSDCTRDDKISFENPHALESFLTKNEGNDKLLSLYWAWFEKVLQPRKEKIYIHDVSTAISASQYGSEVYEFIPVKITNFPYLPSEQKDWGVIEFKSDDKSNIYISKRLKNPNLYLNLLKEYLH